MIQPVHSVISKEFAFYYYFLILFLVFSHSIHSQNQEIYSSNGELIDNTIKKEDSESESSSESSEHSEDDTLSPLDRSADPIDPKREESIRSLIPDLTYQKKSGLGTAISKIYFSDQSFTISGFLEMNSVNYQGKKNREFSELELYYTNLYRSGTYFGYKVTDTIIFNSELQVEYLLDATREDSVELNIEALLDFLIHPSFNIRLGNMPVPLGYVNINEEPIMFHSVNRPDVERILIPTQWLEWGIMLFGSVVSGFDYNIAVLQGLDSSKFKEGSWIRSGRDFKYNGMKDLAYLAKLEWNGLDDFTLGIGAYIGRSSNGGRTPEGMRIDAEVSMGVLNMFYKYDILQLTSVLMIGRLTDTEKIFEISGNLMGERVYGGYLDIGVDVLPFLRSVFPILGSSYALIAFSRYERLDTHDKIHRSLLDVERVQNDLSIWTVGINYKPSKEMVFKLNYQRRTNAYQIPGMPMDPNRVEVGFGLIY